MGSSWLSSPQILYCTVFGSYESHDDEDLFTFEQVKSEYFFFFFWPSVDHGVDEKCEVQYSFEKYLYIYFYRSSVIHVGFIKVCQAACSLCNNIVPQCFQFSCVIFMNKTNLSLCFVVN